MARKIKEDEHLLLEMCYKKRTLRISIAKFADSDLGTPESQELIGVLTEDKFSPNDLARAIEMILYSCNCTVPILTREEQVPKEIRMAQALAYISGPSMLRTDKNNRLIIENLENKKSD